MKTDDLISILSQSPQPRKLLSFKAALSLVLLANVMVTVLVLGLRPDLASITANLTALHKTILLASVLYVAGCLLQESADPLPRASKSRILGWLLLGLFGSSLVFEWMYTPADQIIALFLRPSFKICFMAVTIYGAIGVVLLTWLMKFYAPANEKRAAFAIGLAATCAGALGYSIHCLVDSPTFITVVYGGSILIISWIVRLLAPRFIKW